MTTDGAIDFSLIMATANRAREVEAFIESLNMREGPTFELIVVDQNPDDRVTVVLEKYKHIININHVRTTQRGLSRARNLGLPLARGKYVCFPDDDCLYSQNLLSFVLSQFGRHDCDLVAVKSIDRDSGRISNGYWLTRPAAIRGRNVIGTIVSYGFFIRASRIKGLHFDERMGVGAPFGSAEEVDFVLELLHRGASGRYFPERCAYHPSKDLDGHRAFTYGLGFGALVRKEVFVRGGVGFLLVGLEHGLRPLAGFVLAIVLCDRNRIEVYWNTLKGRLLGFWRYSPNEQ